MAAPSITASDSTPSSAGQLASHRHGEEHSGRPGGAVDVGRGRIARRLSAAETAVVRDRIVHEKRHESSQRRHIALQLCSSEIDGTSDWSTMHLSGPISKRRTELPALASRSVTMPEGRAPSPVQ